MSSDWVQLCRAAADFLLIEAAQQTQLEAKKDALTAAVAQIQQEEAAHRRFSAAAEAYKLPVGVWAVPRDGCRGVERTVVVSARLSLSLSARAPGDGLVGLAGARGGSGRGAGSGLQRPVGTVRTMVGECHCAGVCCA